MPALLFSAVLVFFLGFELFGLPLVLGDPEGHPRAVDLPLQAHQQARHAVLSPDGGGRDLHRRDDVPAGAAAAPPAAERAQATRRSRARRAACASCRSARWKWLGARLLLAFWLFVDGDRAAVGHRAARVRHQLGLRREPRRGVHARQLPRGVRRADARARDLQHRPDRHRGRRAHGRLLHGDRLRHAPPQRRLVALRRLPGAGAARGAGPARRPRVPVGVPVLPAAAAAAHHDLQHVARLHGGVARLRHAAHLVVADAGEHRARGGRRARSAPRAAASRARSRCR